MTLEEAFQELGLKPGAAPDKIKAAYRKRALDLHPDRRSETEKSYYEEKFRRLKEAYEFIKKSDPLPVEEGREPIETEGWGAEIKVPQSRWRDSPSRESESAPLPDRLGIRVSWDLESWALWGIVLPVGAVILVLLVRLIASWVNP